MDEKLILITSRSELKNTLRELFSEKDFINVKPDFEHEKLSRAQAIKLAGLSLPTFAKRIKEGIFKEHGHGRKKFFMKSEIIEALKNNS